MYFNLTISNPLQMVVQKSAMETNTTKSKVALSISNTYTAVTVNALHMRQRILTKGTTTLPNQKLISCTTSGTAKLTNSVVSLYVTFMSSNIIGSADRTTLFGPRNFDKIM